MTTTAPVTSVSSRTETAPPAVSDGAVTSGTAITDGYRHGSPEYRRVMISLFVAGMAIFVVMYDTQALLPEFARHFDISATQATLSMSLATVTLAVGLLFAGPISEMIGRTRLIHFSLWGTVLIGIACALAPSWHALLALRGAQGAVLAGLPAVAAAYLREEIHPSAQARAAGLYIGGTALGGMSGRLITAPVADICGWRWGLAAAALFAAVCAVTVAWLLPASLNFVATPARVSSIASMARGALSDPVLLALYALAACGIGTLVVVFNGLGFRLTSAPFGMSLAMVSLVYLVYALGTISSMMSGRLADAFGRRSVIPAGCVIAMVGVVITSSDSLVFVVVGVAALTIGFFSMHGLASGWVTARAHVRGVSPGQAATFYLSSYYVGSSVFGNLGSTAWSVAHWPGVTALAGALLVTAGVLIVVLRRIPALG